MKSIEMQKDIQEKTEAEPAELSDEEIQVIAGGLSSSNQSDWKP